MSAGPTFACAGIQIHRPALGRLTLVLGVAGIPLTGCTMLGMGLAAVFPALATAVLLVAASSVAMNDRRRPGGELVLTAHGLTLRTPHEDVPIQRAAILAGYEMPARHAICLHLRGGKEIIAELADIRAPIETILEHLGVSVHQSALTAPLRGVLGAFTMGLLTFFGSLFVSLIVIAKAAPGLAWPLAILVSIASVIAVLVRFGWPKVIVGADGVRVTGQWSRQFVAYSQMLGVTPHGGGVQIGLKDGTFLQLATIGQSPSQISSLTRRIRQGMRGHDSAEGKDVGALARKGRSLRVWKEDLRRIALAPAGFREHALSRDDFEKLVVDPRATAEQRIGAALALRAVDPDAASRIRVAATASANDELRDALEACAAATDDLDDPAIERATTERRR